MLVPDVEGTGLPLTELLPYTKIETKEIKKKYTTKSTKKRQEETEDETERRRQRKQQKRKPNRKQRREGKEKHNILMEKRRKATATGKGK